MEILMGFITFLNLVFIKVKIEEERYEDAVFDGVILVCLGLLFMGSLGGLMVATTASMFLSLYFFYSPPKFFTSVSSDKDSNSPYSKYKRS